VVFSDQDVAQFAAQLRSGKGKDVWLMGGADLIGAFFDAGAVDEFIIHVVPVFIGEGIPLIASRHRSVEMSLVSTRRFADGVVRLHYEVARPGRRRRAQPRSTSELRVSERQ
jgi:dihydrofolate reductase